MDEPQKRFTVMPPTSWGRPLSRPTMRARLLPLGRFRVGAAENHIFQQRRVEIGAGEQRLDHLAGEIVRTYLGE